VDFVSTGNEKVLHIAEHENSWLSKKADRKGQPNTSKLFVLNFLFLAGPLNYNLVLYLERDPTRLAPPAFDRLLGRFMRGDDAFKTSRFKLIPTVAEGHWLVKRTVGTTPAILGNKLAQTYYEGSDYLEIDVDVGSSSVGGGILSMVRNHAKTLTVDLHFLLEGQAGDELPEIMLGGTCYSLTL
jgi:hypothetical protein